ncbi:tubulointerstitial nephritis antigen-like [Penaeus japonicus]|uniref:tubulointerstitial nephritis antigen-like n=1 Tax=Penaeus japonicus TaxID=27405 RepID=UPI001C716111|nr:tubulointerstitial nephritis antigen-like [Penaeus japonicus]
MRMAGAGLSARAALLVVVVMLGVAVLQVEADWDYRGIPGNYCRRGKTAMCCTGRRDACSVPIRGTLCYCDASCYLNNEVRDCCPDYFDVCHDISQPDFTKLE